MTDKSGAEPITPEILLATTRARLEATHRSLETILAVIVVCSEMLTAPAAGIDSERRTRADAVCV